MNKYFRDHLWLSHLPATEIDVVRFFACMDEFAISQNQSQWYLKRDLYLCQHKDGNNHGEFTYPQYDEIVSFSFNIEDCKNMSCPKPFEIKMTFSYEADEDKKVFYSLYEWELESNDLNSGKLENMLDNIDAIR